jgi:hypothetical protein
LCPWFPCHGEIKRTNTTSLIEGLVLPVDGTYQIIVSGSDYRTGGGYTLIIESNSPASVTLPPDNMP